MTTRVLINGAQGKMGREAVDAINAADDLTLVAATGRSDDLAQALQESQATVAVDLTLPEVVYENAKIMIESGVHPVIGTSGLTSAQIALLQTDCEKQKLGGIIAPNFSIAAVLMMQFSRLAAAHLPDVEIIEMHHPAKVDAPSGTALKTAALIAEGRGSTEQPPIHSVRLPGVFAEQAVVFGGTSETLTIRHDARDRASMMPGVLFACRQAPTLDKLIYGLEVLL